MIPINLHNLVLYRGDRSSAAFVVMGAASPTALGSSACMLCKLVIIQNDRSPAFATCYEDGSCKISFL